MSSLPTIDKMLVPAQSALRRAIENIDRNAQGLCFIVDDDGRLVGVLTDGDVRRALLKGALLDAPVSGVMQTKFVSLPADADHETIQATFNDRTRHIPLVSADGRPVDYASPSRYRRIQVAQPCLEGNELAYVTECIRTNWISSQGTFVKRFEQSFVELCEVPHALAVANGTVALHLALEALGIGPGDEVIVPNLTFAASVNSVLYTGATPVLADVLPDTWLLDPAAAEKLITPKTKAIMPVHLYGLPCDMDELTRIARKHNLFLVEDCAEALGSRYKGRPVGSFGEASTFSFFGNKTITTGEGGMVVFKDKETYERAAVARDHGMSKQRRYWHESVGYNYRLTNLQAAVGVAQMERLHEFVAAKRRLASLYRQALSEIKGIVLPVEHAELFNSYWLFTVLVTEECALSRDELIEKLLLNGIESRPVFYPLHEMPPYQKLAARGGYPQTERISRLGLSLPSAVSLSDEEVTEICRLIQSVFRHRNISPRTN